MSKKSTAAAKSAAKPDVVANWLSGLQAKAKATVDAKKTAKPAAKKTAKGAKPAAKDAPTVREARALVGYGELSLPTDARIKHGPVNPADVLRPGTRRTARQLAIYNSKTLGEALAATLPAPYAADRVLPMNLRFALDNGFIELVEPTDKVAAVVAQRRAEHKAGRAVEEAL